MACGRVLLFATLGVATWTGCTVGEAPGDGDAGVDASTPDAGPTCNPGRTACDGFTFYRCAEDGKTREDAVLCEGGCHPEEGCVECEPGSRRCDDGVSRVCTSDREWALVRDCSEWGSTCGFGGVCQDECGVAEQNRLNVGCIFYPVPLANYFIGFDEELFDFRIAIANPSDGPANVLVTQRGQRIATVTVPPGRMEILSLPWMDHSGAFWQGEFDGLRAADGIYRLTSDRPVTVYQFNPFEYEQNGQKTHTNDASVLYPAHALTGDYVSFSYLPLNGENAPYVAIAGVDRVPTTVRVTTPIALSADRDGSWERVEAGGTLELTIEPGELVYLTSERPPFCAGGTGPRCPTVEQDPTGLRIDADHPVLAFGGHVCAFVPLSAGYCDHLEEQLAPVETLGSRFTSAPLIDPGSRQANLVRVIAAFDGTTITSDPPLELVRPGDSDPTTTAVTLAAGEWAEAWVDEPFTIETSQPAMVAQYLAGGWTLGDPSITSLVPEEQYHHSYVFVAPSSYRPDTSGQNYLLVIRDPGSRVTLDGEVIQGPWTRIGEREVQVLEIDGGIHGLEGEHDVGAIVYGLGHDTSYAYPAGLDLERITIPH